MTPEEEFNEPSLEDVIVDGLQKRIPRKDILKRLIEFGHTEARANKAINQHVEMVYNLNLNPRCEHQVKRKTQKFMLIGFGLTSLASTIGLIVGYRMKWDIGIELIPIAALLGIGIGAFGTGLKWKKLLQVCLQISGEIDLNFIQEYRLRVESVGGDQ